MQHDACNGRISRRLVDAAGTAAPDPDPSLGGAGSDQLALELGEDSRNMALPDGVVDNTSRLALTSVKPGAADDLRCCGKSTLTSIYTGPHPPAGRLCGRRWRGGAAETIAGETR
jgi:hypothetical protein